MFMIIIPAHQFSPFVGWGFGFINCKKLTALKKAYADIILDTKSHLGHYFGLNKCWIQRGHSTMVVGKSSTGRGCHRIMEGSKNGKKMVNKDDLRKCLEIRGME
ncbi:hypothetical protein K1719_021186 [Acacia pycnantha]|nr:hypothetical protein K1719_021186 [Acacia pycnantha]